MDWLNQNPVTYDDIDEQSETALHANGDTVAAMTTDRQETQHARDADAEEDANLFQQMNDVEFIDIGVGTRHERDEKGDQTLKEGEERKHIDDG